MRSIILPAALAAALAASPASASLIGTTATSSGVVFTAVPGSATVVQGGAPEFSYFDVGLPFLTGDVDATSFTLSTPFGGGGLFEPANAVSLTLAQPILGIVVTLGPAVPGLTLAAFSFSGSTLDIAIGAAGFFSEGVAARVEFTLGETTVPAPAGLSLLGAGLLGLAATRLARPARQPG